jgi:hypothetical protein
MFKKISENLFMILITVLLFIIFASNAQDTVNVYGDHENLHQVSVVNSDSVPGFTVDSLYNSLLDKAMDLQQTVDSMEEASFQYRQQVMFMHDTYERIKLQQKVVLLEELIREIQFEADSLFMLLHEMAKPETGEQRSPVLVLDTVIEGIKVYHYNLKELEKLQGWIKEEDETGEELTTAELPKNNKGGNDFNILPQSPYSPEHSFEYDFRVPAGVFYRIQLAAFSQEPEHDHFGGINPITAQRINGQKITRYFAGKFTVYTEALSALVKVRSAGFKDAFIVGYYNGQRMSVERVREFEKENHSK